MPKKQFLKISNINTEPVEIFLNVGKKKLICEPEFKRQIIFWDTHLNVDTTLYVIETLRHLRKVCGEYEKVVKKIDKISQIIKGRTFNFLREHLADFKDIYDIEWKAVKLNKEGYISLYPTYTWICAINELGEYSIPIKKDVVARNLGITIDEWNQIEKNIIKFIINCKKDNGFVETPWSKDVPTLTLTASAIRLLKILGYFKNIDEEKKKFIEEVVNVIDKYKPEPNNKEFGFKYRLDRDERWLCTTYFGLRMIQKDLEDISEIDKLDKLREYVSKNVDKFYNFINSCWKEGYMISPKFDLEGNIPTTIHTLFAITILHLNKQLSKFLNENNNFKKLIKFMRGCGDELSKDIGGFGFAKGFVPNIYGTRNILEIYRIVEDYGKCPRKEFKREIRELNIDKFIMNYLYDEKEGGFRGYAKNI